MELSVLENGKLRFAEEYRMDDVKDAAEKGRGESEQGEKVERAAKAAADANAEELRIALETKTEQGKSTLGGLPNAGS
jgi:hypothetical protein